MGSYLDPQVSGIELDSLAQQNACMLMMLLVVTLVSMVVISMFRKTADRKQGDESDATIAQDVSTLKAEYQSAKVVSQNEQDTLVEHMEGTVGQDHMQTLRQDNKPASTDSPGSKPANTHSGAAQPDTLTPRDITRAPPPQMPHSLTETASTDSQHRQKDKPASTDSLGTQQHSAQDAASAQIAASAQEVTTKPTDQREEDVATNAQDVTTMKAKCRYAKTHDSWVKEGGWPKEMTIEVLPGPAAQIHFKEHGNAVISATVCGHTRLYLDDRNRTDVIIVVYKVEHTVDVTHLMRGSVPYYNFLLVFGSEQERATFVQHMEGIVEQGQIKTINNKPGSPTQTQYATVRGRLGDRDQDIRD